MVRLHGSARFALGSILAALFIGYSRSLRLTDAQREVWGRLAGVGDVPCWKDFPLFSGSCPCNLANSRWSLANLLIARLGASAGEVREIGRGGMDEKSVLAAR